MDRNNRNRLELGTKSFGGALCSTPSQPRPEWNGIGNYGMHRSDPKYGDEEVENMLVMNST